MVNVILYYFRSIINVPFVHLEDISVILVKIVVMNSIYLVDDIHDYDNVFFHNIFFNQVYNYYDSYFIDIVLVN